MSSLSNGVSLPETYEPLPDDQNFLGKGNFGEVVRVRRRSDEKIVACKTISFQDTGQVKLMAERERTILSQLNHQNIITLLDVRWIPNRMKIYMEYCEHGSLQDLINETERSKKRLCEEYIWRIAFQISAALLYCHYGIRGKYNGELINPPQPQNAVLHRDIKPANVFIASPDEQDLTAIKLGDFGLGQILQDDTSPASYVGTHQYMPPEINRLRQGQMVWTTRCDVFSFGCVSIPIKLPLDLAVLTKLGTMYHACAFKPPFDWRMESGQTYDPLPACYSADLQSFINDCLSFRPEIRPDSLHLFQRAQHKVQSQRPKDLLRMAGFSEEDLAVSPARVLVRAVKKSNKPLIQYLLYRNVNVNARWPGYSHGKAAIHEAAHCDYLEILRLLLHNGADVNLKDDRGWTPLHYAMCLRDEAIARCILEKGPDLTVKNIKGDTPLHFAVRYIRGWRLGLLLDSGADVNLCNEEGRVPLHAAAMMGEVDVVRLLLENKGDVNQLDHRRMAPLHFAANHNRLDVVRLLLDRNAETNAREINGRTPLYLAASCGHVDIVRLIVDHKGDMDCYDLLDFLEFTPLHVAASKGHVDVVRLLLERGADLQVMDVPGRNGQTGWDIATPDVIKMMREWKERRISRRAVQTLAGSMVASLRSENNSTLDR